MRISVALCTHNGAAYIEQQVASILRQVPAPDEIVLGDDASTDDTVAIVERLVSRDPDVDLVVRRHDPALGIPGNFVDALAHARGDLIALSDQDDVWHDGKLATLAAAFEADPTLLLMHTDARLVDAAGEPLPRPLLRTLRASASERRALTDGNALTALVHRNLVTGATVMLRRELRDTALPVAEGWIHDEWLAAIAAALGGSRLLPVELIDYRQHGGNQIGAQGVTADEAVRKLNESRGPWTELHVARWTALAAAVDALGDRVTPARRELIRGRLAFTEQRRDLPRARWRRIPAILRHVTRGDYGRYAGGLRDVARDLLQPHAPEALRDAPLR